MILRFLTLLVEFLKPTNVDISAILQAAIGQYLFYFHPLIHKIFAFLKKIFLYLYSLLFCCQNTNTAEDDNKVSPKYLEN